MPVCHCRAAESLPPLIRFSRAFKCTPSSHVSQNDIKPTYHHSKPWRWIDRYREQLNKDNAPDVYIHPVAQIAPRCIPLNTTFQQCTRYDGECIAVSGETIMTWRNYLFYGARCKIVLYQGFFLLAVVIALIAIC